MTEVIKYLEEIKEHQMQTVQLARSTEVYKLADKALKAINVIQCSKLLLCLVDDFNFLTKDKLYKMQEEPEGHYVVIDDFGEKRLLWKKYFKVVDETAIV